VLKLLGDPQDGVSFLNNWIQLFSIPGFAGTKIRPDEHQKKRCSVIATRERRYWKIQVLDSANGDTLSPVAKVAVTGKERPGELIQSIRREAKTLLKTQKAIPTETFTMEISTVSNWATNLALGIDNPGKAVSSNPSKPSPYDITIVLWMENNKQSVKKTSIINVLRQAVGCLVDIEKAQIFSGGSFSSSSDSVTMNEAAKAAKKKGTTNQKARLIYHVEHDRLVVPLGTETEIIHLSQLRRINIRNDFLKKKLYDIIGDNFPSNLWKSTNHDNLTGTESANISGTA